MEIQEIHHNIVGEDSKNLETKISTTKLLKPPQDDVITIERSIDLVATEMTPFLFILSLSLNCIKFLTYISITENRNLANDDADPGIPSILIVLIFSALSMSVTAFPIFKHLIMRTGSVCLAMKSSHVSFELLLKALLAITELGNFAMLYVTAIFIVPGQGSPLLIVLNCTAIITISTLDEGFFKCFEFTTKKIDKFDDHYQVIKENTRLFHIFVFIFGTIVTFFFLLLLYILYEYTQTAKI